MGLETGGTVSQCQQGWGQHSKTGASEAGSKHSTEHTDTGAPPVPTDRKSGETLGSLAALRLERTPAWLLTHTLDGPQPLKRSMLPGGRTVSEPGVWTSLRAATLRACSCEPSSALWEARSSPPPRRAPPGSPSSTHWGHPRSLPDPGSSGPHVPGCLAPAPGCATASCPRRSEPRGLLSRTPPQALCAPAYGGSPALFGGGELSLPWASSLLL